VGCLFARAAKRCYYALALRITVHGFLFVVF
jgi:hypothetical protein